MKHVLSLIVGALVLTVSGAAYYYDDDGEQQPLTTSNAGTIEFARIAGDITMTKDVLDLTTETDPNVGLTNGTVYVHGNSITPLTSYTETDPSVGLTNGTVYVHGSSITPLTSYTETDPSVGLTNGTVYVHGSSITPLISYTETDPSVGLTNGTVYVHGSSITPLTSYTETDPSVGLTNGTVYVHGSSITPLTSYTETDPSVGLTNGTIYVHGSEITPLTNYTETDPNVTLTELADGTKLANGTNDLVTVTKSTSDEGVETYQVVVGETTGQFLSANNAIYADANGNITASEVVYASAKAYETFTVGNYMYKNAVITYGGEYYIVGASFRKTSAGWDTDKVTGEIRKLGAQGKNSVTFGRYTSTAGTGAAADGQYSFAEGNYTHAEGNSTHANGVNTHTEGYSTRSKVVSNSNAMGNRAVAAHNNVFVWQGGTVSPDGSYVPDYDEYGGYDADGDTYTPDGKWTEYFSHGEGTFNLNPVGGTDGIYIGETNMTQIITSLCETTTQEYCSTNNEEFVTTVKAIGGDASGLDLTDKTTGATWYLTVDNGVFTWAVKED